MNLPLRLVLILLWAASPLCLRADDKTYSHGYQPNSPEAFPAALSKYQILPDSFSPDQQLAFLYPRKSLLLEMEEKDVHLHLVRLKSFKILESPKDFRGFFVNHGSYGVVWSKNSKSTLFINEHKWGPDQVWLMQLNGDFVKTTEILKEMRKLLTPLYKKSKADRYNDVFDFIFEDDERDSLTFDALGNVKIEYLATTDPKDLDTHRWTVRFEGTWNTTNGSFTSIKISNIPAPKH